jgi:hypothetical protein
VLDVTKLGTGGSLILNEYHSVGSFPSGEFAAVLTVGITSIHILVLLSSLYPFHSTSEAPSGAALHTILKTVAKSRLKFSFTSVADRSLGTGSLVTLVTKSLCKLDLTCITNRRLSTGSFVTLVTKSLNEYLTTTTSTNLSGSTSSRSAKLVTKRSNYRLGSGCSTTGGTAVTLGLTLGRAGRFNSSKYAGSMSLSLNLISVGIAALTGVCKFTVLSAGRLFSNRAHIIVNVISFGLNAGCHCKYHCNEHKQTSKKRDLSLHNKEPPFLFLFF